MKRHIKAITLDLDDTLWDIDSVILNAEQQMHEWLASRYPKIVRACSPLELRELGFEATKGTDLIHDRSAMRKAGLQLAAQRYDCPDLNVESAFEVFFQARNQVVLYDEVLPVLERLSKKYPLAALSNGNADLKQIGIDHLFTCNFSSATVGQSKPHPAMFEAAMAYLNLAPWQIVHVGDHPEQDVKAACDLDMATVWVNRKNKEWTGEKRADLECDSLILLEKWLERFG